MVSFSISKTAKTVAKLIGCAALLGLLGAASCEGEGFVQTLSQPKGECILQNPVGNPHPPAGSRNDVLQLADASNVNDFIQCRLSLVFDSDASVNVVVYVSPPDAQGHSFVDSGRPAIIDNLSR
ncbi:MAG TPA: hypothetical protein VIX73_07100 [Kofleriaceae bacterium]|jgi:hypothetical protein